MKQRWIFSLIVAVASVLCATSALAQGTFGNVSGRCIDPDGKPIAGATVRYQSNDTGQKYDLKTNAKGQYMSIGISPAHAYTVTLIGVDGKEIDHVNNVQVAMGDNPPLDFDEKKQQENAAKGVGLTAEQAKQMQERQKAIAKEADTVKALNEKLGAANDASKTGDFDGAIALLTQATELDSGRDLLWYRLGDAYVGAAGKQTDTAEKTKRYDTAITDYQKAIDLKKADIAEASGSDKKPDAARQAQATKELAAYYNSLGTAYGREGNTDNAVAAYNQAAQVDAGNGGMYYFNLGAVLTNANKGGDQKMARAAADAFDKAIAADPTKADAYFWKGSNLVQLATLKGDKMVPPDGTVEAFQKYLELKPDGPHAEESKAMLQGFGATIETSYKKKK